MTNVKINLRVPVYIFKQTDNLFVAETPVFEIATQGKTLGEVKSRFEELVSIFIEELVESGNLDSALTTLGWVKQRNEWTPPKLIESSHQYVPISVPREYILRDA